MLVADFHLSKFHDSETELSTKMTLITLSNWHKSTTLLKITNNPTLKEIQAIMCL